MLHYFPAAGVDEEEIGDLSLDKMPNPQLHRFGLAEDAPVPAFTCKSKYAALIANLGSFIRGRKQTAPSAFSDYLDFDSTRPSKGSLIKSLAQSKSHLFRLCEASEINTEERRFLRDRGWMTLANAHGDILIGSRANDVESSMKRLAGSTHVGIAHEALPCSYMIVEIIYGKTLKVRLACSTSAAKQQRPRLHWRMRHWEPCTLTASTTKLTWSEATPIWHFTGPQGISRSQWTSGEECTRVSGTISLKPG